MSVARQIVPCAQPAKRNDAEFGPHGRDRLSLVQIGGETFPARKAGNECGPLAMQIEDGPFGIDPANWLSGSFVERNFIHAKAWNGRRQHPTHKQHSPAPVALGSASGGPERDGRELLIVLPEILQVNEDLRSNTCFPPTNWQAFGDSNANNVVGCDAHSSGGRA